MQGDRVPKLLKLTNRWGEETEDDQWRDSRTTRPERVNEWHNSLNVWWWWWWWGGGGNLKNTSLRWPSNPQRPRQTW
jgi:hypothetical protein